MTPEARQRRRTRTPVLAVSAVAWAAMLPMQGLALGSDRAGAEMSMAPTLASPGSVLPVLVAWVVMTTAMMGPLLVPALRHVQVRSLPSRRRRSTVLLVVAWAATWATGGLVLLSIEAAVRRAMPDGSAPVVLALGAALLWQASPLKQRCLNRHHRHPPVAAFGRTADRQVLLLGGSQAVWCFGSCWALMLLTLLVPTGQLPVMVAVALWVWAERFDAPVRPTWRLRPPVTAARLVAGTVRTRRQPAWPVPDRGRV